MPNFEYHARNAAGQVVVGQIEASSSKIVAMQLLKKNITPIKIEPMKNTRSFFRMLDQKLKAKKIKIEELIIFCRQMSALTKAGVPLIKALTRIKETIESEGFVEVIGDIVDSLSSGQTFAMALKKYPDIFKPIFVSVMDAWENSGQLDEGFIQLSKHLELEAKTIKQLKAAGRYPITVIVVLLLAFIVVNFMVIPAFADLFSKFGQELPLPTRILMALSKFFIHYWLYLLTLLLGLIFGLRYYFNTKNGRYIWDRFKLKMPVIGPLINRVILSRFSRTFAMMVHTGVPLVKGMNLIAKAVDNEYIGARITTMGQSIERGETLPQTAINSKLFSPLVIQMLSVGEESGTIDTLLLQVAEFYEEEVEYDLKRMSDLIEPILLIIMAVMVLVLAMGIFLPMWDMVNFTKR